jgi:hypothetical protein
VEGEEMAKVDPETAELLRTFCDDEWLRFYNLLVLFARRACGKLSWRTGKTGHLPEGHTPETIAQEAITRLFDGRRGWNREAYPGPSPMGVLIATADSIVGDLVRSEEHKRMKCLTGRASSDSEQSESEDQTERLIRRARKADPLNVPDAADRTLYLQDVFKRIRERVSARVDLLNYFECLMEDLGRSDIARKLRVSTDRVDELRKQFLARTEDIYEELFGEKKQQTTREARVSRK